MIKFKTKVKALILAVLLFAFVAMATALFVMSLRNGLTEKREV